MDSWVFFFFLFRNPSTVYLAVSLAAISLEAHFLFGLWMSSTLSLFFFFKRRNKKEESRN